MKLGQSTRFVCRECLIAFDITVAPRCEWPELPEDESENDMDIEIMSDAACPFCGSGDITARHDQPTTLPHGQQDNEP